jgi:cyclopropane fatty-acyl-phospholipid synthase-like methyltransferase
MGRKPLVDGAIAAIGAPEAAEGADLAAGTDVPERAANRTSAAIARPHMEVLRRKHVIVIGAPPQSRRARGTPQGSSVRRVGVIAQGPTAWAARDSRPTDGPRAASLRGVGEPVDMTSMKLYDRVERIHAELRELGVPDDAPLTAAQLAPFDQYHYLGTDAVDLAATSLGLAPASRVLEIGSGIGGPARHLASTVGCHVVALELQPELSTLAEGLTARCGLDHLVRHVSGDVLDGAPPPLGYDALLSILCVLHISDRARLFARCREALRPGGRIYLEDFSKLREPTAAQWEVLRIKVQCPYLPTPPEYVDQLVAAGFVDVALADVSEAWMAFTADRLTAFRAESTRNRRVHGDDVVDGLDDFYATVAGLYAEGVLGGALVSARRP